MDKKSRNTKGHPKSGPAHPDYATLLHRSQSFRGWPQASPFRPRQLADGGFFYLGLGDRLKCFMCGVIVEQWNPEYGPWRDHQRMSQKCPFANDTDVCVDQPVTKKITQTTPVAFKDGVESQDAAKCLFIMCQSSKNLVKLRRQDLHHLMVPLNVKSQVCLSHFRVSGWSRKQIQTFYSLHNTVPEAATLNPEAFKRVRNRDIDRELGAETPAANLQLEDEEIEDNEEVEGVVTTPHQLFWKGFQQEHSYSVQTRPELCSCPPLSRPTQKSKLDPNTFSDSVYTHVGWGASLDDIKHSFINLECEEEIDVQLLLHHEKECINKHGCLPFTEEFVPTKKVTVFAKANSAKCVVHQYLVVAVLVSNVVSEDDAARIWQDLVEKYIPLAIPLKFLHKENFSSSLKSQGFMCSCNKNSLSLSVECGNIRCGKNKCKYSLTQTLKPTNCQRFSMGNSKDVPGFEKLCHKLADLCSNVVKKFAPVAHFNLEQHMKDANLCQLGTSNKVFGGLTIVSEFVAHFDDNNVLGGCTSVLSLKKHESTQCHVLTQYSIDSEKTGLVIVLPHKSLLIEAASLE